MPGGGGGDGGFGDDFISPPLERREELFVSEEYKIFMLPGRPDSFTRGLNHICVRPFNTVPPECLDHMRAQAKPWTKDTADKCKITIDYSDTALLLSDKMSGVKSEFPISELDEDVRRELLYVQHIRVFNGSSNRDERIDPWQKYTGLDHKDVESAVTADSDIKVAKPLTLKKPGGGLSL